MKSQQTKIEQAEKDIAWYKEDNQKIEERKTNNDEAIRAEVSLVAEVKEAKLVTESSKAAFNVRAGLDPDETKTNLDISPKEFRDKCLTLKGGKSRCAQILMNRFLPLFDEEQMLDEDEAGWGE